MDSEREELAERIVKSVQRELYNRKGYDYWWDDVDEVTRGEITYKLEQAVIAELRVGEL